MHKLPQCCCWHCEGHPRTSLRQSAAGQHSHCTCSSPAIMCSDALRVRRSIHWVFIKRTSAGDSGVVMRLFATKYDMKIISRKCCSFATFLAQVIRPTWTASTRLLMLRPSGPASSRTSKSTLFTVPGFNLLLTSSTVSTGTSTLPSCSRSCL